MQDAGADGIRSARRGSSDVDILYEDGAHQTVFDGDPEGQNLTSDQYETRMAAADARYARLLRLLTSAVDK